MRLRFVTPVAALGALMAGALGTAACITQQPATDTVSSITSPSAVTASGSREHGRSGARLTTPSTGTATTTPSTGTTTTVTPPANVTIAYQQDVKAALDADCLRCHSNSRADGGYSVSNYAQVMRAVSAGNANSILIRFTQRGASMYRYWSGSQQTKADLVRNWIVSNAAAETR